MSETARVIRQCGHENPRSAAINKAVEESGLGFPEHRKDYPSLIGKTVVLAWTKQKGGEVIQRGETCGSISGLTAVDNIHGSIIVVLGLKCIDPRFRLFTYNYRERCWQPQWRKLPENAETLAGVSVQINLA